MSERQPHYETGESMELDPRKAEKLSHENHERLRVAAEEARQKQASIEALTERVEKAAQDSAESKANSSEAGHDTNDDGPSPVHIGARIKGDAYDRQIDYVQQHEKPAERNFSKFIHQPVIEEVSNVAESTIARPLALLYGGLFAVITNLVLLYVCRRYGYEYNFMIGLAGFAGGFVVGLIIEGAVRLLKPRR